MSENGDTKLVENNTSSSTAVELTPEAKAALFEEFKQQMMALREYEKENEEKDKDKSGDPLVPNNKVSSGKHPAKKRKRDDDAISLLSNQSSYNIDEDDETDRRKEGVQPWLEKYGVQGTMDFEVPDEEFEFPDDCQDDVLPVEESPAAGQGEANLTKEMEGILRSRYKAIMEHTKEKMGDPVVPNIEGLIGATWGKLKLAAKTKTDLQEKIPIPKNCAVMKAPRLNTEVYIRVYDNASSKDEALRKGQNDITKATVPVLRALGDMEKMEAVMEKSIKNKRSNKEEISKEEKFLYKTLKETQKQLTTSVLMLNYNFTETTRKRKFDICSALGPSFRPYASAEDTGEYLFGVETQKAMKSELKKVNVKATRDFRNSKNFQASGKAPRSFQSGGFRFNNRNSNGGNRGNHHNNNNHHNGYNNHHHNNNNNNNNRNSQYRSRGRGFRR